MTDEVKLKCPKCGENIKVEPIGDGYGKKCKCGYIARNDLILAFDWQDKAERLQDRINSVVSYIKESETGDKWQYVCDILEGKVVIVNGEPVYNRWINSAITVEELVERVNTPTVVVPMPEDKKIYIGMSDKDWARKTILLDCNWIDKIKYKVKWWIDDNL